MIVVVTPAPAPPPLPGDDRGVALGLPDPPQPLAALAAAAVDDVVVVVAVIAVRVAAARFFELLLVLMIGTDMSLVTLVVVRITHGLTTVPATLPPGAGTCIVDTTLAFA